MCGFHDSIWRPATHCITPGQYSVQHVTSIVCSPLFILSVATLHSPQTRRTKTGLGLALSVKLSSLPPVCSQMTVIDVVGTESAMRSHCQLPRTQHNTTNRFSAHETWLLRQGHQLPFNLRAVSAAPRSNTLKEASVRWCAHAPSASNVFSS